MSDTNDSNDMQDNEEVPLLKATTTKKPRTQKQQEAFSRASSARKDSIEKKKMEKKNRTRKDKKEAKYKVILFLNFLECSKRLG